VRAWVLALLVSSCKVKPEVGPEEVVQGYLDRIKKADYRGAWELLSEEDRKAQPLAAFEEQMRVVSPVASRPVKVDRSEIGDGRAVVYYTTMVPNLDDASSAFVEKVVDVTLGSTLAPDAEKMARFAERVLPMLHAAIEAGEIPLVEEQQKLELVVEGNAWRIRRSTEVPAGDPRGERFVDRALRRWAERKGMPMLAPSAP
jgi:hypothetical protein